LATDRSARFWGILLAAYFVAVVAIGVYVFSAIWPVPVPGPDATSKAWQQTAELFGAKITISDDLRLILMVMVAGVLGSCVHGITSLTTYFGNEALGASWAEWYLLRPFVGLVLALIFYLAIRGGLLSAQSNASEVSPHGITAMAAIVGMFSKQATDKLQELFTTLFRTEQGGDAERADSLKDESPKPKADA
jgi:hypothetical protein